VQEDYAERLGEEGSHLVQVIHDGSRSMDEMIVGLLAFSRSTRQQLEMSTLDMAAIVRGAVAEARGLYQGPAAAIEVAPLPPAMGDSSVIRHVWSNLIGNALKFSAGQSAPALHITGRVEGDEVVYQVKDNGVGFDMQYADKLFGVFKRLHRADDFPGTGVGLAIAHRIVTRHGGRIWAESAAGAGACFQFTLPAVPPDPVASA
jgi:light-regulated signal transduction histidine kinase (bacteriophytochrome)